MEGWIWIGHLIASLWYSTLYNSLFLQHSVDQFVSRFYGSASKGLLLMACMLHIDFLIGQFDREHILFDILLVCVF